jgi:flagellin
VGADASQGITFSIQSIQTTNIGQIAQATGAASVDGNAINGTNLTINGVNVTTSVAGGQLGQTSDSAFAKALAINSSNTGVRATASSNTRTDTTIGAFDGTETLTINSVTILTIGGAGTTLADVNALRDRINSFSSSTGVTATVSGTALTLTAADGRNIRITSTGTAFDTASDTFFGSRNYRSTIQLTDDQNIVVNSGGALIGFSATQTITPDTTTVQTLNIETQTGANDAINRLDSALQFIGTRRGELGALQNRLESAISNLSNVAENDTAARSRILDVDFASETVSLTRSQVLQQAGAAMLSQTKASSQLALSLLQ